MLTLAAPPLDLRRILVPRVANHRRRPPERSMVPMMKYSSMMSSDKWKRENSSDALCVLPEIPDPEANSSPSDLRFNKLQPLDEECDSRHRRVFGCFIAREALLDEEYWTAAWLRAESHWEDQPAMRQADSYKRKFAEQEFNALKRRCGRQHAKMCDCIIAVKKEERKVKRTVLKSIVGTLDISIRHLLCGETFPGEHVKAPLFSNICRTDGPRYGYVANLCVAKYARRQGIATNMLLLALEAAKSYGIDQVFVHVHKDNLAARELYHKIGFQMVEMATPHLSEERKYLLCLKL